MKTDRIDTTQFHITSVQDDQSEIKLSSGSISVDLLHKREKSEDEGIISIIILEDEGIISIILLFLFFSTTTMMKQD